MSPCRAHEGSMQLASLRHAPCTTANFFLRRTPLRSVCQAASGFAAGGSIAACPPPATQLRGTVADADSARDALRHFAGQCPALSAPWRVCFIPRWSKNSQTMFTMFTTFTLLSVKDSSSTALCGFASKRSCSAASKTAHAPPLLPALPLPVRAAAHALWSPPRQQLCWRQ